MVPRKSDWFSSRDKVSSLFGISHIHFTEPLLQTSSPIIPKFHLSFNNILTFCRKKHQKSQALRSRTRFFPLFWYLTTVSLHSGTWFSAVPQIIPASQVLSKNATAGFGQGFYEKAPSAQPLPEFEISCNWNAWLPWLQSWSAWFSASARTTPSMPWAMPAAWENCRGCKPEQISPQKIIWLIHFFSSGYLIWC